MQGACFANYTCNLNSERQTDEGQGNGRRRAYVCVAHCVRAVRGHDGDDEVKVRTEPGRNLDMVRKRKNLPTSTSFKGQNLPTSASFKGHKPVDVDRFQRKDFRTAIFLA